MLRLPLIATAVVIAALVVVLPLAAQESVMTSLIAALAFVVGAWCAPASFTEGATGSLLTVVCDVWTRRLARTKTLQLVIGAVVMTALILLELFEFDAPAAGIVGISAAICVGAVAGADAPGGAADEPVACDPDGTPPR